ncbi:hypothetical protein DFH27DRAFT_116154 [Peziza echinospora]|nr:hypothetical protein DFH27DRAFT_116154 [Peziza echinospora]
MYFLFPRQDGTTPGPPNPDDKKKESGGGGGGGDGGMSAAGIAFLVLFILLLVGGILYVIYTHIRARRLGLPSPGWRTYVPFLNNSQSRGRPSTGPLGWIKSKIPNSGTSRGGPFNGSTGYTGAGERSRRTQAQFGQLRQDDEEAWDARGYRGLDDDTEMHQSHKQQQQNPNQSQNTGAGAAASNRGREFYTNSPGPYYNQNAYGSGGLGPANDLEDDGEPRRGRSRSREPPYPSTSAAAPQAKAKRPPSGGSVLTIDGERRSVFREAM